MKNIGIIDIGSNTVHLSIVRIDHNGSTSILNQDKEHIHLGSNIKLKKNIDSEKILDTLDTLKRYSSLCTHYGVENIITVATEALRVAENSGFVIDCIKKYTGLSVRVLSKFEEAYLSYLGVSSTYNLKDCILMDLGGSSTELVSVKNHSFVEYISLPYGSINTFEKIKLTSTGEYISCDYSDSFFDDIFSEIPFLNHKNTNLLFGIGGTCKNLKNIFEKEQQPNATATSFATIDAVDLLSLCSKLNSMSTAGRSNINGLSPKRCDLILGGIQIISSLINHYNFNKVCICDEGLRTGLLINYIHPKLNLE